MSLKIDSATNKVYELYTTIHGISRDDDMLEKILIEFYKGNNCYSDKEKIKIWESVRKKLK